MDEDKSATPILDTETARYKLKAVADKLDGRQIKVFVQPAVLPSEEKNPTSEKKILDDEEKDEFFEFTLEDYARVTKTKKEEKFLIPKKIREEREAERRKQIKNAKIRIQFPNAWIIETLFSSNDTILDVKNFVKKCLINENSPFYLFTAPPKKILKSEKLSLYDALLAPASLIYFSFDVSNESQEESEKWSREAFLKEEICELKDLHLIVNRTVDNRSVEIKSKDMQVDAMDDAGKKEDSQIKSHTAPTKRSTGKPKWMKLRILV